MKIILFLLSIFILVGCDQNQIDDFVFERTLKKDLIDLCGEKDKLCIEAVEKQIKNCIKKADGRRFIKNSEDEKEVERFTKIFYSCLVNRKGEPVFDI